MLLAKNGEKVAAPKGEGEGEVEAIDFARFRGSPAVYFRSTWSGSRWGRVVLTM